LAADKPELLPWRSRLKDRRAARAARGREYIEADDVAEPAAQQAMNSPPLGPNAASSEDEHPTLTAGASDLQLPNHVGTRPEPIRPDVVVD
jgi:hypothetical protein